MKVIIILSTLLVSTLVGVLVSTLVGVLVSTLVGVLVSTLVGVLFRFEQDILGTDIAVFVNESIRRRLC